MSLKIYEAREHCKTAEKYLKTSLMRWKPDYDSAADQYSQAAQCYRIARDVKNSKDCYLRASENYKMIKATFHAGKSVESALMVCKGVASADEIFYLSMEASTLYQQHGSCDSAAVILDKGGKLLEENSPELAFKLFQQAADICSANSSNHQSCEYLSKVSRLLVRMRKYDQALDSLRREIGLQLEIGNIGAVGRLTVVVVLVQLARGDPVAAEKAYKEWGTHCEAPEVETLDTLLQAYDDHDREGARYALSSPFIRSMDVEYARLAKSVPLPDVIAPAVRAARRANAAANKSAAEQKAAAAEEKVEEQSRDETAAEEKKEKDGDEEQLC